MRRLFLSLSLLCVAPLFAKDIYFPIAGSTSTVGSFRTDVRLFNPSSTKDITVNAFLLPVGNRDNSGAAPHPLTVPKRGMLVLNDVVTVLGGTDLDALRFSSPDDFVASERIYADGSGACNPGTFGQDVPPLDPSSANAKGVLLQLRATTAFRTNIGILNPNGAVAKVTFKLYDKTNALVSTGSAITVQPMGVVAPTSMVSGTFFAPGGDLTDAWVSYTSDQPVIVYASLVDNGTNDPTFISMAADSGTTATTQTHNLTVTTRSFAIDFSPAPVGIKVGDTIVLTIRGADTTHGLEIDDPDGKPLIALSAVTPGSETTRTITITKEGLYNYYCTRPTCGDGHSSMFGQLQVGQGDGVGGGPGY